MNPLKEKLKNQNGGRILDVGTGHCQFLKQLIDFFAEYTEAIGIDFSEENIKLARQETGDQFRLEVMDAAKIDFANASFDTVSIQHSLHHIAKLDTALLEMKRVLKPGGLFIISEVFQAEESERENSQRHLHHWWSEVDRAQGGSHLESFTKPKILQITDRLNLIDIDQFEYREEFESTKQDETLTHMLTRSKDIIKALVDDNGPEELISKGEELIARFSKLGFVNESAFYILGRKSS